MRDTVRTGCLPLPGTLCQNQQVVVLGHRQAEPKLDLGRSLHGRRWEDGAEDRGYMRELRAWQ